MALSWTLDKVGPLARSAEDCALVLDAVRGADGRDPSAVDRPFSWSPGLDPRRLRVGWVPELFEEPLPGEDEDAAGLAREQRRLDRGTLEDLRALGIELVPIELPDRPVGALSLILTAEASAAFDELTRSGRDDLLVRQEANAWPNVFRQGRTIPAVEYVQANRIRTLLARDMEALFARVDLYVTPAYGGSNLLLTNLTGHPMVALPNGFRADGTPGSVTVTGALFGEAALLTLAEAYQRSTDHHSRHPDLESGLAP
jgi:Asp-tRNA(Asn)/Glu-tRNA(Gln) amidotransferase A subunit family amidase